MEGRRYMIGRSGTVEMLGRWRDAPRRATATTSCRAMRCPDCGATLAERRYAIHALVAHGRRMPDSGAGPSASHAGDVTGWQTLGPSWTGRGQGLDAALDGGRGLHLFARDRGAFGSMPAFDDHGEESRP